MSSSSYRFLDPADIRRLKNYEFGAKALVEGYMAGQHRSNQRGASTEFHEFRQYTPGDDLSRVDWRVFARNDKLFLRTFEQDTNLECNIFIDCSASMGFPEQSNRLSKLEYASFFAAALSWWVISKNDRVSLTLFDQGIRKFIPANSTRKHLNDILHSLETNQPGATTDLAASLHKANPLLKRKGTLIILSDFFSNPADLFRALNPYIHRGFQIHLFHILDQDEIHLRDQGLAKFIDMETADHLVIHPHSFREVYHQELIRHTRSLRSLAQSRKVDYHMTTTTDPYFSLFDRLRK